VSLANELGKQGHDAQAVEGEKSQFDVIADGELIFSKQREGRFPEADEISTKL
jgi:predicted Rdx family selenoprotein